MALLIMGSRTFAALVLLLTVYMPAPAAGRFKVLNLTGVTPRGTLESSQSKEVAVELMQYHHVHSPYARPNLTLADRVDIAVKSSKARLRFFYNQLVGKKFGTKPVFSSPVFFGEGSYLMQFRIGTPARTFVAIADTGSDLVWVQCATCTSCFSQPDAVFNPRASSSYTSLSCHSSLCSALPANTQPCSATATCLYFYAYGDQSTTAGDLATDTVGLTTTTGLKQSFGGFGFGCGHRNQGTFGGTDGLVGLGQGPLSLVVQLGAQFGNRFSYCLVDFFSARTKTSALLLGGGGTKASGYTPLVTNLLNPTFYYVNLVGITVAGVPLSYASDTFAIDATGSGGIILDSGTTITQLHNGAFAPLVNRLKGLIRYTQVDETAYGFDLCFDLSKVVAPVFPRVVFQFQGVNVALPDSNLFVLIDDSTSCLAIQGSGFGLSIYGNFQQQNFHITYDRGNRRVGFAPTTC